MEDLTAYTVKDLKVMCKEAGLTGYSRKSKEGLIKMLETATVPATVEEAATVPATVEEAATIPAYSDRLTGAIGDMWDTVFGGHVTHDNIADSLLASIRAGIGESGIWMLTDGMVCKGHADYAIGVYSGGKMIYALPIAAHGTHVAPASIYGDAYTAPVWYATVPLQDAMDAIRRNADNAARYEIVRDTDGTGYAVKLDRHGRPIARKYTMRKYAAMVATCVEMHIYEAMHVPTPDWSKPRGMAIRVRLVRDLEITH